MLPKWLKKDTQNEKKNKKQTEVECHLTFEDTGESIAWNSLWGVLSIW